VGIWQLAKADLPRFPVSVGKWEVCEPLGTIREDSIHFGKWMFPSLYLTTTVVVGELYVI